MEAQASSIAYLRKSVGLERLVDGFVNSNRRYLWSNAHLGEFAPISQRISPTRVTHSFDIDSKSKEVEERK